jgi:gamma-glutamylputrescine oxidase
VAGGFRDYALDDEFTAVEATTPVVQGRLERFAAELMGEPPRIAHRWAGIFGSVDDLLPLAGRILGHDGVWVAAGYSGHGNVLGLACGDLVARAILDDAPAELFDPARMLAG